MKPDFVRRIVHAWPSHSGLCCFLVYLLTSGAGAQTATTHPNRPLPVYSDSQSSSARQASVRKNGRFLGWKFAAISGQDTGKWRRRSRQDQQLSAEVAVRGQVQNSSGQPSPGGFSNAGFETRPRLPAGFIPTAITSGDFNEDGKMDFAISNGGDDTIYVFLGNGDGTFKVPEILYTQGHSPDWITAVKLRKNGFVDLAVTDGDSNTVELFLGNGDGTFQPSTQTLLPQVPTFILPADVNNDGNQDLVVGLTIATDSTQPQFAVLVGNGLGAFSGTIFSQAIYGNPDGPVPTGWVAIGDLNNDGYVDAVVTVTGGSFTTYLSLSGNSFPAGNFLGFNDGPMVVGLGDMDGDGCLDAVQLGAFGLVTIAKGTCDGNFTQNPNPTAMVGDLDPAIQIADVDGDGHLDVIGSAVFYPLADNPEAGTEAGYLLSVLKGDGKGNLSIAQTYRGGTDAYSLVVADFNGDGRPEILTADSLENQVSLFTNDGSGNYGPPVGETIGYTIGPVNAPDNQSPLEVADLNGDGKADLLFVEYAVEAGGPPELTAILNDGTGKFLPPVRSLITGGEPTPVPTFTVGAFRNPAKPDVIYINTYDATKSVFSLAFFAGNGDGTFNPPVTLTTLTNPQRVVAGDFNNDGKLDFAVVGTDPSGQNWEFNIFLGHGDGTFTQSRAQTFPILSTLSVRQFFAIDLNHDGKLDLLVAPNANLGWVDSGDDLIELLGNGDGTFQPPTVLIPHFGPLAVADLNRDGYPDLIQDRDPNTDIGASFLTQPGVTVYLGSADGTFHQQTSYDLPGVTMPSFNPLLVGDFNGDGIPDIAVRCWVAQPTLLVEPSLVILQGVGDGTFVVTSHAYQLPGPSVPIVGADFNGDGATDLVEQTGITSSFTTIPASPAPTLDIAIDSNPVVGNTGKATVSLDLPAPVAETVTLAASDPAIRLPASAQFSMGQQTQDVSFALGSGFDTTHVFALYATLGTHTATAFGTQPNPNLTVGVTSSLFYPLTPLSTNISVEPGESFQMFFTIQSKGGYSGTFSSLNCSGLPAGASCSFQASTIPILPGGAESVAVTISTSTSSLFGRHSVTVSASDGSLTPASSFKLGIGDFSLSFSPTIVVVGPTGNAVATISSTATNGLNEQLSFACSGLPDGTKCGPESTLYTSGPSTSFGISHNQLAASDYPFQIIGTADTVSHTTNAVLRVGDFTAALDKTTATLSGGQSATFNLTLNSVNHYTSSITVICNSSAKNVACGVSPSPATLTDDGTTAVQLTLTNTAAASGIRHVAKRFVGSVGLLASLLPLILFFVRSRKTPLRLLVVIIGLAGLISCGGGSGGGGQGGPPPPPPPTTVKVSVLAQAAVTPSDNGDQKTVGPIVIRLN
jgi:FG-GAP-like repeat